MAKLELLKGKLNSVKSDEELLQEQFQRLQPQKPTIRPQYLSLQEPSAPELSSSVAQRAQVFDFISSTKLTVSNSVKDYQKLYNEQSKLQIISIPELFEALNLNKNKILFIDIRPLEIYLKEHIGYPSGTNQDGGIINLEPEFITDDITLVELEKLCDMGCINDKQRKLFLKRSEMDYIVLYDQKSRNTNNCFQTIANLMDFKKIFVISGGFLAWSYFLTSSSKPLSLWIESGEALDRAKR